MLTPVRFQATILLRTRFFRATNYWFTKHSRPILHEALISGFRQTSAQPNIVCEIIDNLTMLQFVAHGIGIALVPLWVKKIAPPGMSFIPFETCDRLLELYVAYRRSGNSDTVKEFLKNVKQGL